MSHKPKTQEKHVGLEVEFSSPIHIDTFREKLKDSSLIKYCDVGHDGSPSLGHECSLEIKVLMKQKEIEDVIPQVFKLLNDIGCKTNKSHGIHVHLDMRKRNAAKAYTNLVRSQDVLFQMAHPSRKKNKYCIPNNIDILEPEKMKKPKCWVSDKQYYYHGKPRCECYDCFKYAASIGDIDWNDGLNDPIDHYNAISDARKRHQTLEVRIRESTLDGKDVLNWIKTLIKIADGKEIKDKLKSVSALEKNLRLSSELKEYINERTTMKKKALGKAR